MDISNVTNETRLTRIQALVVEILNELLRAPIEDTDATIQSAIARIGNWCKRDRSYVFVMHEGLISNSHEWCGTGIAPMIDQLKDIPWEAFGPMGEAVEKGEPLHVPDVAALDSGSVLREILEMQQIRSILVVPMRHDGGLYGFIGFDGVTHTHAFLPGELYLLQSVADVTCTVLARRERETAVTRAQQELAEERAFLASILATSALGVMVIDSDGIFRFVNDAAATISGLSRDELIGHRHDSPHFAVTHEGGSPVARGSTPYDMVMATGKLVPEARFELHRPDGLRYCAIHAAPVTGDSEERARVVYAMLDVTERVAAERAREDALDEARRANAAKSNFLAKMSHEMRTPLNGVLGIAEVLERQMQDDAQRRMVSVLRESGGLLLGIINDLLDMTKIEADRMEIEAIAFDPGELAQRVEAVHTLKASEKRLSFGVQLLGDAHATRIGDPHRLLQILHNLIGNAVKFTEDGTVRVVIDCRAADHIEVLIEDTGVGMEADALSLVFEDFEQADSSISRRFGGTGLGLPIVKRLVAMMGGKIAMDSVWGGGTRVRVELPIALAGAGVTGQVAAEADQLPDLSALRILAADDNRTNRMILGAMLGQLGVSAVLVADGRAALQAFERQDFDIVILDISMPDMDGLAVMREIRRRILAKPGERGKKLLSILAFTANAMSHQIEAYLEAGFDDCLTKPLQLRRLTEALESSVASARRSGNARSATDPPPCAVAH